MLHLKKIPVGIDTTIQALQKKLNNKLITTWGISDELYRCYGRCYRNQSANGYVPEVFISDSVGYKDLFLDDNYAATSFFGVERMDINDNFRGEADVHLVFAVNLKQLKPSIRHRADEEVHQDVIKVFNKNGETKLNSIVVGIENVFREYTAWKDKDKGVMYRDMQPFHFFRINFRLKYIQKSNC